MTTGRRGAQPATIPLALACALLSGALFAVLIVDFGAHVDGVGIGCPSVDPPSP